MSKEKIINDIEEVIITLELLGTKFNHIAKKYHKTKEYLIDNNLSYNPIKGSCRAFLDVTSDWENPILEKMSKLESKIELFVIENLK